MSGSGRRAKVTPSSLNSRPFNDTSTASETTPPAATVHERAESFIRSRAVEVSPPNLKLSDSKSGEKPSPRTSTWYPPAAGPTEGIVAETVGWK